MYIYTLFWGISSCDSFIKMQDIMTPYMKTIFQQKKTTEILTKISGSAPLTYLCSVTSYCLYSNQ